MWGFDSPPHSYKIGIKMKRHSCWVMKHKSMTDEEVYQHLKNNKDNKSFMDADEWKALRLVQLGKEGRVWSR